MCTHLCPEKLITGCDCDPKEARSLNLSQRNPVFLERDLCLKLQRMSNLICFCAIGCKKDNAALTSSPTCGSWRLGPTSLLMDTYPQDFLLPPIR